MNPHGNYKAVKDGWSWTAFFFTGIWALVNQIWVLGIVATIMEIGTALSIPGVGLGINLFWSIIFGIKGNKMLAIQLLKRGYDDIAVVKSSTPEGAIAAYLKQTKTTK